MESNKIIVNFARVKNILIADIVNMPKELVNSGTIISNERYSVVSVSYAEIKGKTLYLTGSHDYRTDNYSSYSYNTEDEAQAALEGFSALITEYNKRIKTSNDCTCAINWRRAE